MQPIERYIHKLHYRTFKKVWPHVKAAFGDTPQNEQLTRDILDSFVKDIPKKKLDQKKYYNTIVSDHPHAWIMDILDNGGQTDEYNNRDAAEAHERSKPSPPYWLMLLNINTRYAVALPLDSKDTLAVRTALLIFLRSFKCRSLTSDKEMSFVSNEVVGLLTQRHISQYIVPDQNHTTLSLIDSFIRHLRDRNTTNEKSKYQSHHSKYRNFSWKRMKQLIDVYNNTVHSTTGLKPIDMQRDIKLERQWIAYNIIARSKMRDHTIPNGNYVRIILSKDAFKKRRYRVSHECYQITGRDGKNYIVSAADRTSKVLPRHRLIDLGNALPAKHKLTDTIPAAQPILPNRHHPQLVYINH